MSAILAQPLDATAADLFGDAPLPAGAANAAGALAFSGILAHHAEVRMKTLDEQHFVPVLCLDIEQVGIGHHRVHAEQPFTEATRHDAELLARRLRKGHPVTVTTGLADIRLFLPAATISATPDHH